MPKCHCGAELEKCTGLIGWDDEIRGKIVCDVCKDVFGEAQFGKYCQNDVCTDSRAPMCRCPNPTK